MNRQINREYPTNIQCIYRKVHGPSLRSAELFALYLILFNSKYQNFNLFIKISQIKTIDSSKISGIYCESPILFNFEILIRTFSRNSGVITTKVCKDFPRKSANTFAPSKVCMDFHSESPYRLSGRKYLQTLLESLWILWR